MCETLREVAEAIREGEPSSLALGNYMAFLKPNQIERALEEAPALLALRHGAPVLAWTEAPERFLQDLHFQSRNNRLNELLYLESPKPFRRCGIMVSSNALDGA